MAFRPRVLAPAPCTPRHYIRFASVMCGARGGAPACLPVGVNGRLSFPTGKVVEHPMDTVKVRLQAMQNGAYPLEPSIS